MVFLFQLEEKSTPRMVVLRKGEFIRSLQSQKGGQGLQEVFNLTPITGKGELYIQMMLYRVLPSWVLKALKDIGLPAFLGDLLEHSTFSMDFFSLYPVGN